MPNALFEPGSFSSRSVCCSPARHADSVKSASGHDERAHSLLGGSGASSEPHRVDLDRLVFAAPRSAPARSSRRRGSRARRDQARSCSDRSTHRPHPCDPKNHIIAIGMRSIQTNAEPVARVNRRSLTARSQICASCRRTSAQHLACQQNPRGAEQQVTPPRPPPRTPDVGQRPLPDHRPPSRISVAVAGRSPVERRQRRERPYGARQIVDLDERPTHEREDEGTECHETVPPWRSVPGQPVEHRCRDPVTASTRRATSTTNPADSPTAPRDERRDGGEQHETDQRQIVAVYSALPEDDFVRRQRSGQAAVAACRDRVPSVRMSRIAMSPSRNSAQTEIPGNTNRKISPRVRRHCRSDSPSGS